jgi:hypothetical protein
MHQILKHRLAEDSTTWQMAHFFVSPELLGRITHELQEQTESFYKNWAQEKRGRRRLQQRQWRRAARDAIKKCPKVYVSRKMSQLKADALRKRRLEAIRQVFGPLSTSSTAMSRCGVGKLAQMARYRARIKGYMETMTQHGWDRKRPEIIPETLRSPCQNDGGLNS